jgi:hypothetical protein
MILLSVVFLALLLMNVPLAFVVGISAMTYFILDSAMPLMVPVTTMIAAPSPSRFWRCRSSSWPEI